MSTEISSTDPAPPVRTRRANGGVSVKEVARIAGVAVPTAYEALRGDGRLREETRERVRQAATQLGYRPNRTALNMRRGRHGAFGLLLKEWTVFPKSFLFALLDAARQRDHFLLIEYSDGKTMPRLLREDCIDGLVVFETLEQDVRAALDRSHVPVVEANTNLRDRPGCITYDEPGGVRKLVRHLAEIGRKRPAMIVPWVRPHEEPHYSRRQRIDTLPVACREFGLDDPKIVELKPHTWDLEAYQATLDKLAREDKVDTVILYSDAMAAGLYHSAHKLGLDIPADIAVAAFNNSFKALEMIPKVTSVGIPPETFAEVALDLISKALREGQEPERQVLEHALYVRESTVPE